MFAGPLFSRELLTASRSWKHYALRTGYLLLLFVLVYTAGQVVFGFQQVRTLGETARFGQFVFNLLAIVQVTMAIALALVLAASTVSTEKDRRTLVLLLMTDLDGRELVIGKMLASLVGLLSVIAVSLPALSALRFFGGITLSQVLWLEGLCVAAGLMAAAWATLVAYWREKTFQTLAVGTLGAVLFLAATAGLSALGGAVGRVAGMLNPYITLGAILDPLRGGDVFDVVGVSGAVVTMLGVTVALLLFTIWRVRVWNPSEAVITRVTDEDDAAAVRRHRQVWDKPVLWREVRTRAYGRKTAVIKLAYVVLAAAAVYSALTSEASGQAIVGPFGAATVLLGLVSVMLLNAQAVTSVTNERDGQTLELLLATEVPVKDFVLGKLFGTLWNGKELLLAPLLIAVLAMTRGVLTAENFFYVVIAFLTLGVFSTVLGLHFGLSYPNSRQAIAGSLGTMMFLFLGIFVCMLLIVEGRSSFAAQFTPFLVFILGGSLGLWAALTYRQPSPALTVAAAVLPFCTFYALTGYLLGNTLGVALFVVAAYGFTTVAMLVPAVNDVEASPGHGAA